MSERIITHIPADAPTIPTIDHPFRVAAYCRVSSPSEDQYLSLETQITYFTAKITMNIIWKNAGVFADTATGRNMKERTEYKKLLRELYSRGVDVYFEQENIYLLDPAVQHIIEIYCALAQNESENKSHNIKWGIQVGFEQGTSGYQNFACFGYRFDQVEQQLAIVPEEAVIVRKIFDLRLQAFSYGKISAELAKEKISSPTGKSIRSRECIRKMLCNEKYAGTVLLQKTYLEDFLTGKQKKNIGQMEKYLYKNNHEAIVSREGFEMVQGV